MAPFLNGDLDLQDAAEACEVRSCHRSANEDEPPSCWKPMLTEPESVDLTL